MEISKIKLIDIEPADYNPRTITEEARKKLRNSIETFGLVEPIIINTKNNRIIGGHQRYQILLDMLMESDNLAEREFDYLVKDDYGYIFDFNQLQIKNEDYEKALNIVLNNTNLMGDYDYQKLGDLLNELEFNGFNLEFTGFEEFEVKGINAINDISFNGFDDLSEDDLPLNSNTISDIEEEEVKEVVCPYCGKSFEV
ncbi:MAG: ParB N-terminal domain-containing protein [Methanobrevibacter sp.]|nr:ParB N-terminal domain-containing protein [Methanobrevibacter sp.]